MESKNNNSNVKPAKKTGRPKKTSTTSVGTTSVGTTSVGTTSVGTTQIESKQSELKRDVIVEEFINENQQPGKPEMVDKAVNTLESALRDPPKQLDIPLNLEPFTYDEILDYSDDLDLSYYKGRAIERERDEMRYSDGYRHEVIINDKSIGHAIFHNKPGKSYWNGYINLEPTYCNPFIVQEDITRINFLGCQLKEVTYIDDEHFGFSHLTLEDLDFNIFTGEPRKRFYATLDVVEKEIIALYIFLNFFISFRLGKKKKNIPPEELEKQNIEIELEKKPEAPVIEPPKTKGRKPKAVKETSKATAKETSKPVAKGTNKKK